MGRYKGVPSLALKEARYPFGVIIAIPEGGLGRNLDRIMAAAQAAGDHVTTGRNKGIDSAVRYGFATESARAAFQAAVDEIAPGQRRPDEPLRSPKGQRR